MAGPDGPATLMRFYHFNIEITFEIMRRLPLISLILCCLSFCASTSTAQFRSLETEHLRLVYYDLAADFLAPYVARSYTNSLQVYQDLLGYEPSERITIFLHDGSDYGNASADVIPRNRITIAMAPLSYWYETSPANERMNSTLHHEMIHVASNDGAAGSDNFFRFLFQGKVAVSGSDPVSILYSYLTAPRRYAPRWYQEGIAVFMETWVTGQGRSLGGYDEMMFRTSVRDGKEFYDVVGLESEGTTVDFQVGVNSYLYGTRFMSYLAHEYDPEKVLSWFFRDAGSKAYFASQFKVVFGLSLDSAWEDWIDFERKFQQTNLERIRSFPVTEHEELTAIPLGSMSRSFVDPQTGNLLVAVNYPGKLSHLASIDMETGKMKRLTGIRGPSLYTVTSLAFDSDARTLFYTTDNSRWRDLMQFDLATGKVKSLMKNERVGDLVINPADKSLWGVRHFLGFSTLVRIPAPYDDWDQIMTLDYGTDIYDLDISPDGSTLTAARVTIDGSQKLVSFSTEGLMAGNFDFEQIYDFGLSNPEGFVFSPDGEYLLGSSYYSGVSNIYRIDLETNTPVPLTNSETGYFRPQLLPDGRLLAFSFSADGFEPVVINDSTFQGANSIIFLGDQVVQKHPVVMNWLAPPPSRIDLDEIGYEDKPYRPRLGLSLASVYPIIQGYQDGIALGLRFDLTDPVFMHEWKVTASYSTDQAVPEDERLHLGLDYYHRGFSLTAGYNTANFYDLFGPTKRSRKGLAVRASYHKSLAWEGPKRNLSYTIGAGGFFGLDRLPDYQNVGTSFNELYNIDASLDYTAVRSSLGAVDNETGIETSITASANIVNKEIFPRVEGEFHIGTLLPIEHLSVWLRTMAGISAGKRSNEFANFYFGGFHNNWVDKEAEKQFRTPLAFPGLEIDEIGGTNFGKVQVELMLPPVRFRSVGGSSLYLKWIRPTAFVSGIATNITDSDTRVRAVNVGGQIDLRIMMFSYLKTTLSAGWARARLIDGRSSTETMISLKIL